MFRICVPEIGHAPHTKNAYSSNNASARGRLGARKLDPQIWPKFKPDLDQNLLKKIDVKTCQIFVKK